jgi:hypothetical protein
MGVRRSEFGVAYKCFESEAESTETQIWLVYSFDCGYLSENIKDDLYQIYDEIPGMLVNMRLSADKWKSK